MLAQRDPGFPPGLSIGSGAAAAGPQQPQGAQSHFGQHQSASGGATYVDQRTLEVTMGIDPTLLQQQHAAFALSLEQQRLLHQQQAQHLVNASLQQQSDIHEVQAQQALEHQSFVVQAQAAEALEQQRVQLSAEASQLLTASNAERDEAVQRANALAEELERVRQHAIASTQLALALSLIHI